MDLCRRTGQRRLKVFEKIAPHSSVGECISRVLEVSEVEDCEALAAELGTNDVQLVDTRHASQGVLRVAFFDIRRSEELKKELGQYFSIKFLPANDTLADQITVPHFEGLSLQFFQRYGDVMAYEEYNNCVLVRFYDTRNARNAYIDLFEEGEENPFHEKSRSKDAMNISISSDSTVASPYFFAYSSESDSRESPFDERRKPRKKPLDEDEKHNFVINLERLGRGQDLRTTVMVKNIPNKYTQSMLLETINRQFAHTFDFFYLPIDFKVTYNQNKCNVGYAFINFLDYRVIPRFYKVFNGKRWERFKSDKVCALSYARIQGRQALINHFESSSVMSQEDVKVKPLIFPIQ